MTTSRNDKDPIFAWGQTILIIGGGLTVHELGWRWYILAAIIAAELALLAWRKPLRTPPNSN